jgi:hypothetical protein
MGQNGRWGRSEGNSSRRRKTLDIKPGTDITGIDLAMAFHLIVISLSSFIFISLTPIFFIGMELEVSKTKLSLIVQLLWAL